MSQLGFYISKYANKFVVLDTNILLVYLVGCIDPNLISSFKKTSSRFCVEDFKILNEILSNFRNFITTPNILTEVSNLGGQLSGKAKDQFFIVLSEFIRVTSEEYLKAIEISSDKNFIKFGITDRVLLELSENDYLIITDDYKLSSTCKNSLNYNNLRPYVSHQK